MAALIKSIVEKWVALYVRLSRDDENEGDSNTSYDPDKRSTWTLFPSINLLGASWSDQLAYNYGLALANEGLNTSVDGWYSPSCNMHRSPFCGRVAEYPSED